MKVAALACIFVASPSFAQEPTTLAAYLAAHPVENCLILAAENRKPTLGASGLGAYGRKTVKIGSINAVVPISMVRFDDSLKQVPNFYDGIPRDAKVLYLISTLDSQQWKAAAAGGIGLGDLRGEQRDVFLSILPKPFRWTKYKANADWHVGEKVAEGVLDEKQVQAVRLRIERRMQLNVQFTGSGAYTVTSPDIEAGPPGSVVFERDNAQENNPDSLYGMLVRSVVPNALKKGQLDTAALNESVTLPAKRSVEDALALVSAATKRDIRADIRVRGFSLAYNGGTARAGDVLDAIAVAVSGTYRKVDSAYVLVADVVGAGERALRLSILKGELDQRVKEQQVEWRKSLIASGLASNAVHDLKDPLAPNAQMLKRMERAPWDKAERFFPSSELTAELRSFLGRSLKSLPPDRQPNWDKVGVDSLLKYRFVLPDGNRLQPEGMLGFAFEFQPQPAPRAPGTDPAVPLAENPGGAMRPLVVRLNSVEEAKKGVAVAKEFGFSELWVESERKNVLAAAISGGIPTRLFVRPWSLSRGRPDSDKNLFGETGSMIAATQGSSPSWASFIERVPSQGWPRLGPVLLDGDLMSPFDPQWQVRRNSVASLGKTPGLAGVVLSETGPRGYEAEEDRRMVYVYPRTLVDYWALGYDARARLAFFTSQGLDPVDLYYDAISSEIDVHGAFFPRQIRQPVATSVDAVFSLWTKFRAKTNSDALRELGESLAGVPLMLDVRRITGSEPPSNSVVVRPWQAGDDLPTSASQFVSMTPEDVRIVSAPLLSRAEGVAMFVNAVRVLAPAGERGFAVDLGKVPATSWEELLRRSLKPKAQ